MRSRISSTLPWSRTAVGALVAMLAAISAATLVAMLVATLAATLAAAQQPPARDSARPAGAAANVAYRYRLLGVYDEDSGEPIEGVEVLDVLNGNAMRTSKTGTVSLVFLPDGGSLVRLRKPGYATQTLTASISRADTTPITVVMTRATTLATTVVTDSAPHHLSLRMAGFEARKAKGDGGHFIDEAEMRKHDNSTLANVIITHMPGLTTTISPAGQVYISSSRKMCSGPAFRSCKTQPDCYPTVYIDGVLFYQYRAGMPPVDYSKMSPVDYAAAEFYSGGASVPEQFSTTNADCGVLLLWTRER